MLDKNPDRTAPEPTQADPQLTLSSGRATWLQGILVVAVCACILGIMIYGLNRPVNEGNLVASQPGGAETTGAAPTPEPAQTGGNVAGGENAGSPAAATRQQNEPSQQAAPEQIKPAMPDDSQR